ncbi:hypothetical protein [Hymenobacter rubripertinctus]|uniref:Uncharacterized protein n=1 Tax=Hymenobacter rubripertinctus TaxID=2029981 RepID=A0A418QXA6_9BACT|nr:hypothetical protein [Hymenobacter rubripertinctus]RIY09782.1 hypothetical protein D0T11_11450 [Hymenobacter rubripertinctus]
MKSMLDKKLDKISDIWNHYIWEYKFCNSKIKFTPDVKSNYFGDILNYFSDTSNLIYGTKETKNFTSNIEISISFLQAIYIQQDFIEELLYIFKCNINKGDLKKDKNYSINREIRNELIGHPIRKIDINGTRQLLSSTIFSNSTNAHQISYIKYQLANNYKFEEINHRREDILNRHLVFTEKYFDIIISRLKNILFLFKKQLQNIELTLSTAPFENILKTVSNSFEYFYRTDYLYKPETLLRIHTLKDSNERYNSAIKKFYIELRKSLADTKDSIDDLINDTDRHSIEAEKSKVVIPKIIIIEGDGKYKDNNLPISYDYEIGKLSEKDSIGKFRIFSSFLKTKCKENKLVISEIENMEKNFDDDLEYYCSLHLIEEELSKRVKQ